MTAVLDSEQEHERESRRLPSFRYLTSDDEDDYCDDLCRDEGLEVVISADYGDGQPEFHLPDVDGSSAPLDASMSRRGEGGPAGPGRRSNSASEVGANTANDDSGSGGGRNNRRRYRRSASENDAHPASASSDEAKKLGYIQMARLGYQELVNAIIRPPRAEYRDESLGPTDFNFCGKRFHRADLVLKSTVTGHRLRCSHWEPTVKPAGNRIPVVIYMHGNSSARVEVVPQLSYILSLGLAVFSFDFAGSGKSDGDYVSLGYHEREDLTSVVSYLRGTGAYSTIALWGRSMGAATALMHGDRDPSIACMILDSPFADLTQLAEEMVERGKQQGINVPNFVTSVALRMIRGSVKKQANFDIKAISPISHADRTFIPALFVAGEHDDFIDKRHSESIHARYAGDKNLIVVEGDHNSPRPKFMFDSVSIFLQTCLQVPTSWALRVPPGMNLMAPPWFFPGSDVVSPAAGAASGGGSGPASGSPCRRSSSTSRSNTGADTNKNPSSSSSCLNSAPVSGSGGGDAQQEAEVAAAAAREAEEMGMTVERQREIQASLFKMLGQSEEDTGGKSKSKRTTTKGRSSGNGNGTGNRSSKAAGGRTRSRSSSSSGTSAERTSSSTASAASVRGESPVDGASSE